MNKCICIYLLLISLLFLAYADAQCSHCDTTTTLEIADCLTEQVGTDIIDLSEDNAATQVCDILRNQAKCFKDCYCKCLSDSDNTGAKNEIAALEDALKTNSCPEFAQNCIVWKEGRLHVSSTPVSAHASKILMIMSCLFIFTLTR